MRDLRLHLLEAVPQGQQVSELGFEPRVAAACPELCSVGSRDLGHPEELSEHSRWHAGWDSAGI